MPNVLNEFAGDGVTQTFNFSMTGGYLSRDYVYFFTRPNDDLLNYTPYNDDDVTWLTDFSVRTANPIPIGTTFVILRSTTLDPLVDFQNTSRITEKNLDTATWQAIHIAAENSDTVGRIQVVATDAKEESALALSLAQAAATDAAASAASAQAAGEAAATALAASLSAQQEAIAAALSADQAAATAAQADATAASARTTAQSAASDAATALATANNATTASGAATSTANNALSVANAASGTANAASATANAASAAASSATATANQAISTANEAKALVDEAVAGAVISFNGRSGTVVPAVGDYTAGMLGLGNVDNTRDADKPVSTAQSTAINNAVAAVSAAKADKTHTHSVSDVPGLQTTLDGKASASHTHPVSQVSGLQAALDGKSDTGHGHSMEQVSGLSTALAGKSAVGHTHTKDEVTGLAADLSGLSNALASKADTSTTTALSNRVSALESPRPVRYVNGAAPDGNGNVSVGGGVPLDSYNKIGEIAILTRASSSGVSMGAAVAGSSLYRTNFQNASTPAAGSVAVGGTWRFLGHGLGATNRTDGNWALYQRIG